MQIPTTPSNSMHQSELRMCFHADSRVHVHAQYNNNTLIAGTTVRRLERQKIKAFFYIFFYST